MAVRISSLVFGIVAAVLLSPASAQEGGPSFDCGKASGAVEKMICGDAALAKSDRQLASVYAAAAKKAVRPFQVGYGPSRADG